MTATDSPQHAETFEAATYRRIAWRVIPFLFVLYIVAFLDRVNVSFAKLQMAADLQFSDAVYGFGAGMFFFGYFIFEVPSNLILEKVGARVWIARILVVWGLISAAFMYVEPISRFLHLEVAQGFYLLRFLLGIGEAGFFPGIILYLTYWFPSQRRARMTATFMTAVAISGVIGGPLSGWIMKAMDGANGWAGWQWLFLLEGLPAAILGFATLAWLDDGPRSAKWLTAAECELVAGQIDAERSAKADAGHAHFSSSLRDHRVWALALIYFSNVIAFYGVSFFLPQLIRDMGVKDVLMTGFYSAIPWAVAAVAMFLNGRHSDMTLERRWHVAIPALVAAVGLASAAWIGSSMGLLALVGLTLATAGSLCVSPVFWSLPTAFLTGSAAAGSIALINSVGNLGGFCGPYMIGLVKDLTGSPANALFVLSGFFVLCAVVTLTVFQDQPGIVPGTRRAAA